MNIQSKIVSKPYFSVKILIFQVQDFGAFMGGPGGPNGFMEDFNHKVQAVMFDKKMKK